MTVLESTKKPEIIDLLEDSLYRRDKKWDLNPEKATRQLVTVPSDKVFLLGKRKKLIRGLENLLHEFENMDEGVFSYHVTREKDDFVKWIEEVIGSKPLAENIRSRIPYENRSKHSYSKILSIYVNLLKEKSNAKDILDLRKETSSTSTLRRALELYNLSKDPESILITQITEILLGIPNNTNTWDKRVEALEALTKKQIPALSYRQALTLDILMEKLRAKRSMHVFAKDKVEKLFDTFKKNMSGNPLNKIRKINPPSPIKLKKSRYDLYTEKKSIKEMLLIDYTINNLPQDQIVEALSMSIQEKYIILLDTYISLFSKGMAPSLSSKDFSFSNQIKLINTYKDRIRENISREQPEDIFSMGKSETPIELLIKESLRPFFGYGRLLERFESETSLPSCKRLFYLDNLLQENKRLAAFVIPKLESGISSVDEVILESAICIHEEAQSIKKSKKVMELLSRCIKGVNEYKESLSRLKQVAEGEIKTFEQVRKGIASNLEENRILRTSYSNIKKSEFGYSFDLPNGNINLDLHSSLTLGLEKLAKEKIRDLVSVYASKYNQTLVDLANIRKNPIEDLQKYRTIVSKLEQEAINQLKQLEYICDMFDKDSILKIGELRNKFIRERIERISYTTSEIKLEIDKYEKKSFLGLSFSSIFKRGNIKRLREELDICKSDLELMG